MEADASSTNVLLLEHVLHLIFALDAMTQKNIDQHSKWACVCTQWEECNLQWVENAQGIQSNFRVNVLPMMTKLKDISTVITVIKKHIWDYDVVLECLMLADDWTAKTAPQLLETQDNTDGADDENAIIDNGDGDSEDENENGDGDGDGDGDSEDENDNGDGDGDGDSEDENDNGDGDGDGDSEDENDNGDGDGDGDGDSEHENDNGDGDGDGDGEQRQYKIVGGGPEIGEDEMQGTESEMQQLEMMQEILRNSRVQNEDQCCMNDEMLDSIYSEAVPDQLEECFDLMIKNGSLVNTYEVGHYIGEKKESEYKNLLEIIVRVMDDFCTYDAYHDLKYQCLKCLVNLVGFESVRKTMGTRQILREIMTTTQCIQIKAEVWRGIQVLRAVCDGNEHAKNEFIAEDGFAFIADMYRKCNTSKYVLFDLCVFVYELCETQGGADCVQVVDKTTIDFLHTSAKTHVSSQRFLYNTCRTMSRIATNTQNKAMLIETGCIALMQEIAQTHPDSQILVGYTMAVLIDLQTL